MARKIAVIILYLVKLITSNESCNKEFKSFDDTLKRIEVFNKHVISYSKDFCKVDLIILSIEKVNNNYPSLKIKNNNHYFDLNLINNLKSKISQNMFKISSFISIMAFLTTVLLILKRNKKLIQLKEKEERIKELEEVLFLKEEKIKKISFNLNLRTQAEKIFLEDLRKIKKSKKDSNKIVDELYLNYINMIEIYKKNSEINTYNIDFNKIFLKKLQDIHPELSKKELQYCFYFKNELNAKEIAIIEKITPASVRVFKNRIKNKLNIIEDLEIYLKKIDKS